MFAPHLTAIFASLGRTATYAPPAGVPLVVKAIRQGGGQPMQIGPVRVMLERVRFEVLRSAIPSPVIGATITDEAGATWTVDAVQPVENDAHGLKWGLDVSWGALVTWRSISGTGAAQNPPTIAGSVTVAADAATGASSLSLSTSYAVGKLLAGDAISVAAAVHTVTAPATASANSFASVGIAPPLAADVAAGTAVTLGFVRDVTLKAAISGYQARELQNGVQAGDLRLVVLAGAVSALPEAPKVGDLVVVPDLGTLRVVNLSPLYQGGTVIGWEVQARK